MLEHLKRAVTDAVLFVLLPSVAFLWLGGHEFWGGRTSRLLFAALLCTGAGYVLALALWGHWDKLMLKERFRVFGIQTLVAFTLWFVFGALEIADGYGEGNVLTMLFALSAAALTGRRVLMPTTF